VFTAFCSEVDPQHISTIALTQEVFPEEKHTEDAGGSITVQNAVDKNSVIEASRKAGV
jgi:hypothetical protein